MELLEVLYEADVSIIAKLNGNIKDKQKNIILTPFSLVPFFFKAIL
jgi:hypothetical protein